MTSTNLVGRDPMTSPDGAVAMAAALGPRAGAEAEERRRLLRAVTRLQGGTSGKAHEGTSGTGGCSRPGWAALGAGAGAGSGSSAAPGPCQACARGFLLRRRLRGLREEFEAVVLEIEGDLRHLRWTGRVLQQPRFDPEPSPVKPLAPGEAVKNESISKKSLEKLDPPGAERAGSFGNVPSSSPLPPKPPKSPNLGCGAAKSLEKEGRALAGSQEWDKEWDSNHHGASPEIPEDLQGLSHWELQSHRNHLRMELLWIQQAIASRKQFLMLKQKLGIPNHSGIPEFLDWCGEALQQQHQP
ncbi:IQ domain-containing protein C [Catharus ustulatus]|uniref:IQ domain-containing protein C n=1 Tax=Catharus ustulatus TaxID=91951 RepID=UPI001C5BB74E|nr:IQ domain-containing protein C [Catharus ustulatus]